MNADRLRPRPPPIRTGRLPELDNLKAALVAWIIVGHALPGYVAFGGWEYAEVREVTFSPTTELVLSGLFGPSALVVIGTLFLVAGLFLPGALAEHGFRRFVTQRLARLGGPYLAFALLLWPLLLLSEIGFSAAAFGWRFRVYARASAVTVVAFGALTAVQASRLPAGGPTPWMGLFERISIAPWLLWMAVLHFILMTAGHSEPGGAGGPPGTATSEN